MKRQRFEEKNDQIKMRFKALKLKKPNRLNLAWSNWGFGMERLQDSAKRLAKAQLQFIELHGNHYGPDLGYRPAETLKILGDHGLKVAGICGMFSATNDLSSNQALSRQAAVDYLKREIPFAAAVGASYLLVVPGAVGRPQAADAMELDRSVATLQLVADLFVRDKVRAAIEPIRAAEVSFCHTVADAQRYIRAVNHPGVRHINGDIYHMQSGEAHIGTALLAAGAALTNLHCADSNRCALGDGAMDVDTIIRALYIIGFNAPDKFVTFEPLGPGGDPYPAMYGKPDRAKLDQLVLSSIRYFRERETAVLSE